jgi:hypothetical protein
MDTRLGRQFDPFDEYIYGAIMDVRIYQGALSASEVASIASRRSYDVFPGGQCQEAYYDTDFGTNLWTNPALRGWSGGGGFDLAGAVDTVNHTMRIWPPPTSSDLTVAYLSTNIYPADEWLATTYWNPNGGPVNFAMFPQSALIRGSGFIDLARFGVYSPNVAGLLLYTQAGLFVLPAVDPSGHYQVGVRRRGTIFDVLFDGVVVVSYTGSAETVGASTFGFFRSILYDGFAMCR